MPSGVSPGLGSVEADGDTRERMSPAGEPGG